MEYSFDNFNVFNSNKFAYEACKLTAEELPYSMYNPLYIYGDKGTGKTHLMKAIVNYIKNNNTGIKVLYLDNDDILKYSKNNIDKIKEILLDYKIIIFDDFFNTDYDNTLIKDLEMKYCEIFDYLLLNYKSMIFTGNIEIEELKKIYSELGPKMEYGLCVKIFPQVNN